MKKLRGGKRLPVNQDLSRNLILWEATELGTTMLRGQLAILFLVAVAFIIKANVIFYRILDEVNAARQRSDQISFLFVGLRFTEVIGEHATLFPADRKRNQMKASAGLASPCS